MAICVEGRVCQSMLSVARMCIAVAGPTARAAALFGLANPETPGRADKTGSMASELEQPHLEGVLFEGTHVVDLVLRSLGHNRTKPFSGVPHRLAERRAGDGVKRECASKVTTGAESTGDSQCVIAMRKGAANTCHIITRMSHHHTHITSSHTCRHAQRCGKQRLQQPGSLKSPKPPKSAQGSELSVLRLDGWEQLTRG